MRTRFIVILALLGLWEASAIVVSWQTNPIPPPSSFLRELVANDFGVGIGSQATNIGSAVLASVGRVAAGLFLSIAIGIPVGILIAESPWGKAIFLPVVQLFAPIAPIAWIPIALAILGVGNQTAVAIVFLGVFFLFVLTIQNAIISIPQDMRDSAHVLGLNGRAYYTKMVIPAISPQVVGSMRINFPAAWMAVLAAEMTGLRDGLGAIVMTGRNLYDYDIVMLGVFFIAVIGVAFDGLISWLRARVFWW